MGGNDFIYFLGGQNRVSLNMICADGKTCLLWRRLVQVRRTRLAKGQSKVWTHQEKKDENKDALSHDLTDLTLFSLIYGSVFERFIGKGPWMFKTERS